MSEVWARTGERIAALKQLLNIATQYRGTPMYPYRTAEQIEIVEEMLRESELERTDRMVVGDTGFDHAQIYKILKEAEHE